MIKKISLFAAFVAFSVVAYCDGTCTLIQHGSGYTIRCEGDGIQVNYVDLTNEVYIIENCEELKGQLQSAVADVSSNIVTARNGLSSARQNLGGLSQDVGLLSSNQLEGVWITPGDVQSGFSFVDTELVTVDGYLGRSLWYLNNPENENSLLSQINNIECGSCENSGGGDDPSGNCCSVDLNPIIDRLNSANALLGSSTNLLSSIYSLLFSQFYYDSSGLTSSKRYTELLFSNSKYTLRPSSASTFQEPTLFNMLWSIQDNIADAVPSFNNYLYQLIYQRIPVITNQFSFFINEITSDSPLYYYRPSEFGSYYSYLTNHYVNSAFKNFGSGASGERGLTNWFQRVETLIAALVFSDDGSSTNTVDSSYGQSQQNQIISSLSSVTSVSGSQLSTMSDVGNGLIDSLRILNNSFQQFATLPSDVELVRFSSNTRSAETVSFQSSEITYLVEACRCATTLAWCVGGVWLLFIFVSWTVKQSYGLAVFCWSVLSGVFHH